MKTLAEFKRCLVPGSKWKAFLHTYNKDFGVREVVRKQTNACTFRMENGKESWFWYPTAKDFRSVDEDTVQIYDGETLVLTYTRVKEEK